MKEKLVIFDLDGTLVDSMPDITLNINKTMKHYGFKTRTEEEVKSFVGNGARKIVERSIGEPISEEKLDECLKFYNELYTANATCKTKLYDGMDKVLCTLKERGYNLAIITNKPQMTTDRVYDYYLKKYGFYKVIGQSETVKKKPDKTETVKLLSELNVKNENAYFVGDGEADVMTAINAGVNGISVLWGYRDKKILIESGAKVFAENPLELLDLIK